MVEVAYATRWREAAQLPTDLQGRAKRLLRTTALSVLASLRRRSEPDFLRCLFCHYVFDDHLAAFERLLAALQGEGRFVSTDECIAMLEGSAPIRGRHFHLSMDDGFRNNLTNAAPVLQQLGVPAIFFVPSAVIGADARQANAYCRAIHYPAAIEILSWADVESLRSRGFEIGSHTRTHARFSEVSTDPVRLEDEIAGSKGELESRLGCECKYISWPYGKRTDADGPSLAMAKSAGYRACFGAFRGTVRPGETDPFRIPRHHFELEWPLSHIEYFARGNMEGP